MSDLRELDIARELLKKYGKVTAQAIKELRNKTDMPIWMCADMLKHLWHDMELEQLRIENARLRELASLLLYGATHDAEPAKTLVWSQKVDELVRELHELGMEASIND